MSEDQLSISSTINQSGRIKPAGDMFYGDEFKGLIDILEWESKKELHV